jgi:hypothetical protein
MSKKMKIEEVFRGFRQKVDQSGVETDVIDRKKQQKSHKELHFRLVSSRKNHQISTENRQAACDI